MGFSLALIKIYKQLTKGINMLDLICNMILLIYFEKPKCFENHDYVCVLPVILCDNVERALIIEPSIQLPNKCLFPLLPVRYSLSSV